MKASKAINHDTKWIFFKQGTCSRTICYILNRDFGHPMETEERAIDLMAGGIWQQGYQCGLLWGASLAAGAEAHRRCNNCEQAKKLAITSTQRIVDSFKKRTNTMDCYDITSTDWTSKREMRMHMLTGKFIRCLKLADRWAPEAIKATREGLEGCLEESDGHAISCASEVVRKLGGSEQDAVMVAGFAGGLGLSGSGCGALSAAIWMKSLQWCRTNPGQSGYKYPGVQSILDTFFKSTDYKMECREITTRTFDSVQDHTDFIKEGGCGQLIDSLTEA